MEDEYQYTVPSDGTVRLESPLAEAGFLNFDTEVLDINDSLENFETQAEVEKQVVLDSDDEGGHMNGVNGVKRKQSTPGCFRRLISRVSANSFQKVDSGRSGCDEERDAGPSSFDADTRYPEQSIASNNMPSSAASRKSNPVDAKDSYNQELRNMVRQSLSEIVQDEQKLSSDKSIDMHIEKDVICERGCERSNYVGSLEPAELSQARALDFVDHYLSTSDLNYFENVKTTTTKRVKSPASSRSNGTRSLARRVSLGSTSIDLATFDFAGKLNENKLGATKSSCLNESNRVASNSGLKVEYNLTELDERFRTGRLEQQVQKVGDERDTSDMLDVGFDTQMAAEAMEALIFAPPPTCNTDLTRQGFDDISLNSSKGTNEKHESKDCTNLQKAILGSAEKVKKTKRVRSTRKVKRNVSCLLNEHFKGQQGTLKENLIINEKSTEKDILQKKEDVFTGKEVQKKKVLFDSVRCNSDNQCSKENFGNTSHAAQEIEHHSSAIILGEAKDIIAISEERTDDIMKSNTPLRRTNMNNFLEDPRRIGVRRKYLKLDSASCVQDTIHPKKQENKLDLVVTDKNPLEINPWIYPRRKRTRKHYMPCHSNNNQLPPGTGVHEKSENRCHTVNDKECKKVVGLSVYSRKSQFSSERNRFGSSTRQDNCEYSSTEVQVPVNIDGSMMSKQSSKLDGGCSTPCTGSSGFVKLDASSNGNSKVLKVYERSKKIKQSCNNPSRPTLTKELVRLGYAESLPDFLAKDLRRCRISTKACILFSQNMDAAILKKQRKIVARLGFSIASCCSDATHFVTDRFVRTKNMLGAIALGKPVVTHLWLESCGQAGYLIDERNYILRDEKKEKEIGFQMPVSLTRARQHPLLEGRRVFTTPNVQPNTDVICCLVKAVHGQVAQNIQSTERKDHVIPADFLILSSEEDYKMCVPFLERGASVYSSELLLNGIVIQKLEYERHQLFKDFAKTRKNVARS